jgi:cytidylate kinase
MIITIGRQYGSGGRRLAKMLSEYFNIPLYDKDLINRVSEETGIAGEFFKKVDEQPSDSFLSMFLSGFSYCNSCESSDSVLSGNSLFCMQSKVIRQIASEGDCIFVGRCADYILRDREDVISVFVTADFKDRVSRVAEYEGISEQSAKEVINKADKTRAAYYDFYTEKKWGVASSYDICLNSSKLGLQQCKEIIIKTLEK